MATGGGARRHPIAGVTHEWVLAARDGVIARLAPIGVREGMQVALSIDKDVVALPGYKIIHLIGEKSKKSEGLLWS